MKRAKRPEQEVFDDLAILTATPGYAHVVAYLCLRDNFTWHQGEMRAEDLQHLHAHSRLIRTEMFTLIGLMMRSSPDLNAPPPADAEELVKRTDMLMDELHTSLGAPMLDGEATALEAEEPPNPWNAGNAMREPIFYGGESGFPFQNCDFACDKYAADDDWLVRNRQATIEEMVSFVKATAQLQSQKMGEAVKAGAKAPGDDRLLDAFTFTAADIASIAGLSERTAAACISAFSMTSAHGNPTFATFGDFNAVNGSPLLDRGEGRHILFHFNALADAVYESPFYWMWEDKPYRPTLSEHRGTFTETFAVDRLSRVFSAARVFRGVNIDRGKGNRIGEIDVLVLFGDRAIILQAKSKRLTLAARKGNDLLLREDFKAAVQDAYDQAMDCAAAISDPSLQFTTAVGATVNMPTNITQVYPICLVSDHYPALAFQTEQFLKRRDEPKVLAPLIIDVFTLDVMAEMLERPMRLLSYLGLRALHGSRVMIHHEITLLSYHLKYNLWFEPTYDLIMLEDDFANDIEIAMGARRFGLPGKKTPKGILTLIVGSLFDRIVEQIESSPTGPMIDMVMLAYELGEDAMKELRDSFESVVQRARWSGASDFSIGFGRSGFTIHCNSRTDELGREKLEDHLLARKYRQHADNWFGILLSPADGSLRICLKAEFPWKHDSRRERLADKLLNARPTKLSSPKPALAGRNDPCHCGSGLKYKKCHYAADQRG